MTEFRRSTLGEAPLVSYPFVDVFALLRLFLGCKTCSERKSLLKLVARVKRHADSGIIKLLDTRWVVPELDKWRHSSMS